VLERTLAIGEVSLSGDLRRVSRVPARVREAAQLGFVRVGVPAAQLKDAEGLGVEAVALPHVRDAIGLLLGEKVARSGPPRESAREVKRRDPATAGGRRT
jgi:predicted ATP-dependent serine protease